MTGRRNTTVPAEGEAEADLAGSELGRHIDDFLDALGTRPAPTSLWRVNPASWFETQFAASCVPVMAAVHQASASGDHASAERLAAPLDEPGEALAAAALRDKLTWPERRRLPLLSPNRHPPHPCVLFAVRCALFRIPLAQTIQGFAIFAVRCYCRRSSASPAEERQLLALATAAVSCAIGLTAPASRFHSQDAQTRTTDGDRISTN